MYHICSALAVAMAFNFALCAEECREMKPIEINVEESGGLWYQIARYPNEVETAEKCLAFNTMPQGNGFRSDSVGIPKDSSSYIVYEATPLPNESNKYDTSVTAPANNKSIKYISQYLEFTDSYFIVYGCVNESGNWVDKYWIFSRTKELSESDTMKVTKTIADDKNIKYNEFIKIDNSDCGDEF